MPASGHLKRIVDLTMIGMGMVLGSGWVVAASQEASLAVPAGIGSWIIAAIAVLTVSTVYCELGAALPPKGQCDQLVICIERVVDKFFIGVVTVDCLSSMLATEVVTARQYAPAWFPALRVPATGNATSLGWTVQPALITLFRLALIHERRVMRGAHRHLHLSARYT